MACLIYYRFPTRVFRINSEFQMRKPYRLNGWTENASYCIVPRPGIELATYRLRSFIVAATRLTTRPWRRSRDGGGGGRAALTETIRPTMGIGTVNYTLESQTCGNHTTPTSNSPYPGTSGYVNELRHDSQHNVYKTSF